MDIKWHKNEDLEREPLPAFCDVCEGVMFSVEDEIAFAKHRCCKWCSMIWAASREEAWEVGWRPIEEDIEKYREFVASSNPELSLTALWHAKMDEDQ